MCVWPGAEWSRTLLSFFSTTLLPFQPPYRRLQLSYRISYVYLIWRTRLNQKLRLFLLMNRWIGLICCTRHESEHKVDFSSKNIQPNHVEKKGQRNSQKSIQAGLCFRSQPSYQSFEQEKKLWSVCINGEAPNVTVELKKRPQRVIKCGEEKRIQVNRRANKMSVLANSKTGKRSPPGLNLFSWSR